MSVRIDHGEEELVEHHEINVTPFIDVALVLLIIFMVAAPLATVDIPVDLPTSSARVQPKPDQPVYVTLRPDLTVLLQDTPVAREQLAAALDRQTQGNHGQRVFLRADKHVDYGALMDLLNALRDAGYQKVALISLEQSGAR
jgi:biopolymer transport protein ExbD